MTTGSRNYEVSGTRVLCEGSPADPAATGADDQGAADLAAYCRQNFPNSAYESRPEPTGIAHYCRRPGATGGFTLQPIDLAAACRSAHGTDNFRKVGGQVICTGPGPSAVAAGRGGGGAGGGGGGGAGGGGAGGGRPGPFPLPQRGGSAPPLPFPGPMPGPFASPMPGADGNQQPNAGNDMTVMACQTLGGWRSGTVGMVDDIAGNMETATTAQLPMCDNMPEGQEFCRLQIRAQNGVQAYMQSLMIWQCHLMIVLHPEGRSAEDIRTASEEACAIVPKLDRMAQAVNAVAGTMDPPIHKIMLEQTGADVCEPCLDKQDPQAVAAALDEAHAAAVEEANRQLAELAGNENPQCPADDAFLRQHQVHVASLAGGGGRPGPMLDAQPLPLLPIQDSAITPDVTSAAGPMPNHDFNRHESQLSQFRGHGPMREIKKEMTQNAGRDSVLQDNDWEGFERQFETAKRSLTEGLSHTDEKKRKDALAHSELAYQEMRATHNRLLDRRLKLQALQRELDDEFSTSKVTSFFKELDDRIKRNRQFEAEFGRTGKKLGDWTLKIAERLSGKVGKHPFLSIAQDLLCIAQDMKKIADTLEEDRVIRDNRAYVMDLLEMQGALEILLAQYDARIEAESELIDAFEDALFRREVCN